MLYLYIVLPAQNWPADQALASSMRTILHSWFSEPVLLSASVLVLAYRSARAIYAYMSSSIISIFTSLFQA